MRNNLLKNLTISRFALWLNVAISTTMVFVSRNYLPSELGEAFVVAFGAHFLVSALGLMFSSTNSR